LSYFLVAVLAGFRLVKRPLSVPAASSITALMSAGFFAAIASIRNFESSAGVAGAFDENGGRDIGAAGGIHIGAAVDAVVVENDRDYRQLIAANGFKFHAAETERTVTFDGNHGQAAGDGGANGIT